MLAKVPEYLLNKNLYKASTEANEKKLVRNAFVHGDVYINYGDALVQDKEYFLYFYDRLGDTFRFVLRKQNFPVGNFQMVSANSY